MSEKTADSEQVSATVADGTDDKLLTLSDVARELQLTPDHVRRLVRKGRLGCVREGHWLRVPRSDLEAFLDRVHVPAVEADA